ncbi:DUF1850 domain-containing protein [Roseivivax isoporae]|uniref:DUF1850 domain-containing protein n=1 Tax=Roseivivax isoporae LMG 25204 TaxID=1449351 RepID=X7FCY2_9RHOB|nr:DUF1850 domain-containing protein [Roseivivax isoporae]ETX30583.1 hypothetical protein RISW2_13035 [Roseivivax isoporae LMG 25204]
MTACLLAGAAMLVLAAPEVTLSWTHSVERVTWVETWQVEEDALRLTRVAVRGSGAGMEPGPDAVLEDGWWVSPGGTRVPELVLAASGATGAGWRLCADGTRRDLGAEAGAPVRLAPCSAPSRPVAR